MSSSAGEDAAPTGAWSCFGAETTNMSALRASNGDSCNSSLHYVRRTACGGAYAFEPLNIEAGPANVSSTASQVSGRMANFWSSQFIRHSCSPVTSLHVCPVKHDRRLPSSREEVQGFVEIVTDVL